MSMIRPANTITTQLYLSCFKPPEPRKAASRSGSKKTHEETPPKPALPRDQALELIDRLMLEPLPHPYDRINRVTPAGYLLCRWVLDASLCRTVNRRRFFGNNSDPEKQRKFLGLMKCEREKLLDSMRLQWLYHSTHPTIPLAGRPEVRCIWFSTALRDQGNGFEKLPIDCLLVPRKYAKGPRKGQWMHSGLGIINSDARGRLERMVWEEPWTREWAPVVLLELYSGDPWETNGKRKKARKR
jgi:hypothetical protein